MIVSFEQDPDAPFGTGNFKDEAGRVMYVHDPDTARDFVTTMRGATGRQKVAAESDAIARQTMGAAAPTAQPDRRLALNANDTGLPVPAGNMSLPAPAMPNTAPPTASDAANMSITPEETQSLGGGPPPPAQATQPASGRPQQLVNALNKTQGLPIAQTTSTTSRSTTKGIDRAAVDAIHAEQNRIGDEQADANLRAAEAKDARVKAGIERLEYGNRATGGAAMSDVGEQRAAQAEAERMVALKQEELKANDKMLDPDRVVKNMSAGKKVSMTILAALNGAFGALIGKKNNDVMDIWESQIEQDIQKQKDEIAAGRASINNEIANYMRKGVDAQTAERLARDKYRAAIEKAFELEAQRLGVEGEAAEQAKQLNAQWKAQRQMAQQSELLQTLDREQVNEQSTVVRERPKPADGSAGLDGLMKQLQIRKLMKEEGLTFDKDGNIAGTGEPTPKEVEEANRQLESFDTTTKDVVQAQVALQQLLNNARFTRDASGKLVPPEDIVAKGLFDAPAEVINEYIGNDTDGTRLRKSITLLKEAFGRMQSQGAITMEELQNFDKYIDSALEGGFIQNITQIDEIINGVAEHHLRRLGPVALRMYAERENRATPNRGASARPVTTRIELPTPTEPNASEPEPVSSR